MRCVRLCSDFPYWPLSSKDPSNVGVKLCCCSCDPSTTTMPCTSSRVTFTFHPGGLCTGQVSEVQQRQIVRSDQMERRPSQEFWMYQVASCSNPGSSLQKVRINVQILHKRCLGLHGKWPRSAQTSSQRSDHPRVFISCSFQFISPSQIIASQTPCAQC